MRRDDAEAPDALALVEEAVHLVRSAPVSWWFKYGLGSLGWTAGLVAAWAHVSWFYPPPEVRAWIALGLVALFVGLKALQAETCAQLLAWRMGAEPVAWSWRTRFQVAAVQLRVQASGLLLLPVAALLTLPFGWVFAYYQNATVLGRGADLAAEARRRSRDWPGQNHLGLAWLSLFGLVVWINFATCVYVLPWLANRVLGIENLFAVEGVALLNSTFLALTTVLTWVALDPLVKAFYVLRVFYGQSRRSGADLWCEVQALPIRAPGGRIGRVALLLGVALACALPTPDAAETPRAAERAAGAVELDRAIEVALQQDDFRWSLQPLPAPPTSDHWAQRFLRTAGEWLREAVRTVAGWLRALERWLDSLGTQPDAGDAPGWLSGLGGAKVLIYLLLAAIAGLLVWLAWSSWRRARSLPVPVSAAQPAARPDLQEPNVSADELPVAGWLTLAREQMQAGEWRLAFRALYLAQLAQLAADGWISLGRAKTNRDYEQELARRAAARSAVVTQFQDRRRRFDRVWYGRDLPEPEEVESWWQELSRGGTPA